MVRRSSRISKKYFTISILIIGAAATATVNADMSKSAGHINTPASICGVVFHAAFVRKSRSDSENTHCDRVKISRSDGYRPLKLSSGCDCIVEEDGESSRHDHSRE
jgi:hypothetical protein